jgi:fimbrial chaperone protein
MALPLLLFSSTCPSQSQSLRVSPYTLDFRSGEATSTVTLETAKKDGFAAQLRVFRWVQTESGEEKLEKTEDVVVSPPMVKVRPGAPSVVRLVRVAKTAVTGEETYRLLIDEVPDRKDLQSGNITFIIRQSLPVFFAGLYARPGQLVWKTVERKGKLVLEASNAGQKRVKLLKLAVTDDKNRDLVKNSGLAYVLGGQTKTWELSGATAGKTLTIKAESDAGPINASAIAGKSG